LKDVKGVFAITLIGEIKGYYSDQNFNGEHLGQLIEFVTELFSIQRFRDKMISVLFDGVRFQFMETIRTQQNFTHKLSSIFLGKDGWQVTVLTLVY